MAKSKRSSGGTNLGSKPMLLTVEVAPGENVPVLDLATMTPEEKELFFNVVRSVNHQGPHPVQQVTNMPGFFGTMCRASMVYAGMHVAEYRRLLREMEADEDSIP